MIIEPLGTSKPLHVLFGTPSYANTLSVDHHTSMLASVYELTKQGVSWSTHIVTGKCFIDLARNEIVDAFLDSPATDLIFIDADVGWDSAAITRVLSHKQGVVAGLVPKRSSQTDTEYHQNAITGRIEDGLFEAKEAPTAFMRIKREVFGRLAKPYFKTGSTPEDFGEDIYFCRRWCELGESIWIDADINFSHRGDKVWKGNFYEYCVNSGLLK